MAKISSVVSWISERPRFPLSYLGLVSGWDFLSGIFEQIGFPQSYLGLVSAQDFLSGILEQIGFPQSYRGVARVSQLCLLFCFEAIRIFHFHPRQDFPFSEFRVHLAVVPGASSFLIMAAL